MNAMENETRNANAMQSGLSKCSVGFGIALAIACMVNAILVIAKESSPKVMAGMRRMTGHHWVTHSLVALIVFVLFGFLLSRGKGPEMNARRLIFLVAGAVILGVLMIAGFYLVGD
jgi:membrane-bound metal-dependent hydrolase YbcI (DUF457 family)